jgi:hypothetical protein
MSTQYYLSSALRILLLPPSAEPSYTTFDSSPFYFLECVFKKNIWLIIADTQWSYTVIIICTWTKFYILLISVANVCGKEFLLSMRLRTGLCPYRCGCQWRTLVSKERNSGRLSRSQSLTKLKYSNNFHKRITKYFPSAFRLSLRGLWQRSQRLTWSKAEESMKTLQAVRRGGWGVASAPNS